MYIAKTERVVGHKGTVATYWRPLRVISHDYDPTDGTYYFLCLNEINQELEVFPHTGGIRVVDLEVYERLTKQYRKRFGDLEEKDEVTL